MQEFSSESTSPTYMAEDRDFDTVSDSVEGPDAKKFRSVKEYREKKRLQKSQFMKASVSDSSEQENFVKLLKNTVAKICFDHLSSREGMVETTHDSNSRWREVSRLVSQALLDKESRLPDDIRFNVSEHRLKEAALRRINGYTIEYLRRKYPG